MIRLANTGESGLIWYALAGCGAALHPERRRVYLRAMRAVLASMVVNTAVKQAVRRGRPALDELPVLGPVFWGRSYPSAHATASFAGARVLSHALPTGPVYTLALAMALSRPYLGAHYPSDVIAGAILGDAVAVLVP
ncbi:MAG TPA: phosphatase PAP2 family protein [Thermoleophilaceae bacterium]|nr:phosphatase PAP2 family protein [Thermoleophilaceae bacterium]